MERGEREGKGELVGSERGVRYREEGRDADSVCKCPLLAKIHLFSSIFCMDTNRPTVYRSSFMEASCLLFH